MAPACAPPTHHVVCCGVRTVPSDSVTPDMTLIINRLSGLVMLAATSCEYAPESSTMRLTKADMASMTVVSVPS